MNLAGLALAGGWAANLALAPIPNQDFVLSASLTKTEVVVGIAEERAVTSMAWVRRHSFSEAAAGQFLVQITPVSAKVEAVEGAPSPPPASLEEVLTLLGASCRVNLSGRVLEAVADAETLVPTAQRESLAQAALAQTIQIGVFGVRLPDGIVGVGAEWATPLTLDSLGPITLGQVSAGDGELTAKHTLESIDADQGLAVIRVEETGRKALTINYGGLVDQGWVELSGASRYWVSLQTGAPMRAEIQQTVKSDFGFFAVTQTVSGSLKGAWEPGKPTDLRSFS
jgi:hypothetical protein